MRCLLPVVDCEKLCAGDENELNDSKTADTNTQNLENGEAVSTEWMLAVLEREGLSVPPSAIEFARISEMNKAEMTQFVQCFVQTKCVGSGEVLSLRNERAAWAMLKMRATKMAALFAEKTQLCVEMYLDEQERKEDATVDVAATLRARGKERVALCYELLDIERKHYADVVTAMERGIERILKRVRRVLGDKSADTDTDKSEKE